MFARFLLCIAELLSGISPRNSQKRAHSVLTVTPPRFWLQLGSGVRPELKVGQRVWMFNAQWQRAHGSCAEFTTLPVSDACTAAPIGRFTRLISSLCVYAGIAGRSSARQSEL